MQAAGFSPAQTKYIQTYLLCEVGMWLAQQFMKHTKALVDDKKAEQEALWCGLCANP